MKKYSKINIAIFSFITSLIIILFSPFNLVKEKQLPAFYGFVDSSGNMLTSNLFEEALFFSEGLAAIKLKDKWGYIDTNGNVVIKAKYNKAFNFQNGKAMVKIASENKYINIKGEYDIDDSDDEYDYKYSLSEGLYYFRTKNLFDNKKYGFKDSTGKIVISAKYDDAEKFFNGYARVEVDEKFGYIDKEGKYLHKPIFYEYDCPEELIGIQPVALAVLDKSKHSYGGRYEAGNYSYINSNGKLITDFIYSDAREFYNENALVQIELEKYKHLWGVIDTNGRYVVEPIFRDIGKISENLLSIRYDLKWGYMDIKNWENTIECQFDEAGSFSDGLAKIKLNNKWGYINKNGKLVVDTIFSEANNFINGLAIVKKNDKYGVIDKNANWIIQPNYNKVEEKNNYFHLSYGKSYNDTMAIYNRNGSCVFPLKIKQIKQKNNFWYIETTTKKFAIYNTDWKCIIDTIAYPINYNEKDSIFEVQKSKEFVTYNSNGKILCQIPYQIESRLQLDYFIFKSENSKYGVINSHLDTIIHPIYENIEVLSNRDPIFDKEEILSVFFKVKVEKKWGVIDENGKEVLEPLYAGILGFSNGYYTVIFPENFKTIEKEKFKEEISVENIKNELKYNNKFDIDTNYISINIANDSIIFYNLSQFDFNNIVIKLNLKTNSFWEILTLMFKPEFFYEYKIKKLSSGDFISFPLSGFEHSVTKEGYKNKLSSILNFKTNFSITYNDKLIDYEYYKGIGVDLDELEKIFEKEK